LLNVIKYLIYLFIEINNKFKYIYNWVHVRIGYVSGSKASNWLNVNSLKRANNVETFGKAFKKKALACLILSVIGAIVISYIMNLAHGVTSIIHLAGML
jgi:hypothetical protein